LYLATYGKNWADGLRQNSGCGAGQVRDQPQIAVHWPHTENDQIDGFALRNLENALRWRSKLLTELDQTLRMTPEICLRR